MTGDTRGREGNGGEMEGRRKRKPKLANMFTCGGGEYLLVGDLTVGSLPEEWESGGSWETKSPHDQNV